MGRMKVLQSLIEWGKRFRGFLGIVAFILVVFLALITYLFSQGSFNQVLGGFGKLTGEQFVTVVYLVLGLPFIVILLLIFLSFISTRPHTERGDLVVSIQVSDSKTMQRLDGAVVHLSFHGAQMKTTDVKGEAVFFFPAIYKGEDYTAEVFKDGYQSNSIQEQLGRKTDIRLSLTPEIKQKLAPKEGSLEDSSISNLTDSSENLGTEKLEKSMEKQGTFLSASWLEVGLQRTRSVARVTRADKFHASEFYATGFLIRNNWFLTVHHLVKTKDDARTTTIHLNYQQDSSGTIYPVYFELDPDSGFKTSSEHDWTIVRVKGDANREWSALDLQPVKIKVNSPVNIITHPEGEPKQAMLRYNIITYVADNYIQYHTEISPVSSGSPVFDDEWNLIALHHAGGSLTEPGTKKLVYSKEGFNINCILRDLEKLGIF